MKIKRVNMMKSKRTGQKWTEEEEINLLNFKKDGKTFEEISIQLERSKTAIQSRFSLLFFLSWFEDMNLDNQYIKDIFHISDEEYEKIMSDFLLYHRKQLEETKLKKIILQLKKENKIDLFIQFFQPFDKENHLESILTILDMEENIKDKETKMIFDEWLYGINYQVIMIKYNLNINDFCTILRKHLFNLGKKMKIREFYEKICRRVEEEDYVKMKEEIPEYHPLKTYIESIEPSIEKYKDYKEEEKKELPSMNEYVKEKIGKDYLLLCQRYNIEENQLDKILDELLTDKNYEKNYKMKYYGGWFNNSSDKFVKTQLLEGKSIREIADMLGRKIQEVDERRYKFIEDELKILVDKTSPKFYYK